MSAKSHLLTTIATAALVAASASSAQTTDAPASGTPTGQAAAPNGPTPSTAVEELVVTGIRASLRSAETIKRTAPQIIDSVVAEDIGKLPDISVADTAARIAGVQVYRTAGEASSVLVRGLPYFETTYDGREIFTAETRVVALQDFPSQNVAALQVIKTSTADLVEPGLAGSVNVVSRKPFDFSESTVFSASAQGNYSQNADKWRPQGNVLLSHRWNTSIGEMGFLVNGSYTELRYLDNELSNTDFVANPTVNGQEVRLPDIERLYDRSGDRVRPSVNAAFQWKPTSTLEVYAGALWQGFRNRIDDRQVEADLYNAASYNNLTFRPGTNLVTGGTIVDNNQPFTFQGGTYNKTDTYQYSGGLKWNDGRWHASADIARTTSVFTGSTESIDRRFLGTPSITFNNTTPQFDITGLTNPDDPSGFLFQGLFEENQRSAGQSWQARVDVTYDIDNSFLKNIQIGGRYTDRDVERFYGNRYAFLLPLGLNASTLPVQQSLFNPGFAGTDVQGFRQWAAPTYGSIRDNIGALRQFVIANCPAIVATGDLGNGCLNYTAAPVADPLQYSASEQTYAGYIQANYEIGNFVDGAFGVRVVQTRQRITSPAALSSFAGVTNEFTDALPNVSARFKFTPQFQGRLSFSQTRTLPNFSDLNPGFTPAGNPSGGLGHGTPTDPQFGSNGNPNLKPYKSDNYDASLEFYPSRTSFVSVGYFHRELSGFIQYQTVDDPTDPVYGFTRTTIPYNTGKGHIDGVEIQGQSFLDVPSLPKWVQGFGLQANVTFLKAKTQQFDPTLNGGLGGLRYERIVDQTAGSSNFLYNVQGIYEQGPISFRATLSGRSSFLATTQYRGGTDPVTHRFVLDDYYYETGKPAPRLDLSFNYNLRDNATLFVDWTNVTLEPFRQDESSARGGAPRADFVRYIRYDESVISVGARIRLGR